MENIKGHLGLYEVASSTDFRITNLNLWKENSSFWLHTELKHIDDIKENFVLQFEGIVKKNFKSKKITVVDVGCGNGYVYEILSDLNIEFDYIGIDFNPIFVEYLENTHKNKPNFMVYLQDIEESLDEKLIGVGDIVLNLFNFFEIPDLGKAIENTTKIMKKQSFLMIYTIDVISQILTVSKTPDELNTNINLYVHKRQGLAYSKTISVKNGNSSNKYYGLSYSMADYIKLANISGLKFIDYQEINKTNENPPELFQVMIFRK